MTTYNMRAGGGTLTTSTTTALVPPGTIWTDEDTNCDYVYVYHAGADAIVAADAVGVFTTVALGHVSVTDGTMFEISDGTTTVKACAGVAVGAIAAGSYGWLAAEGLFTALTATTDGSVASGAPLAIKDATKTFLGNVTAASAHVGNCGYALAADSDTTLTGFVLTDTWFK